MRTLIPIDTAVDSIVSGEETDHYMPSVAIRGVTHVHYRFIVFTYKAFLIALV